MKEKVKETAKNEQKIDKEKPQSMEISYIADKEPMSNNPYNLRSYYQDGYTYVKKGNAIYRIQDETDEWEKIYENTNASAMGFTIYKNLVYAFDLYTGYGAKTDIVKMNLDGSSQSNTFSCEGLASKLTFYQDIAYLQVMDLEGKNLYKGYELSEDGGFGAEVSAEGDNFIYGKINQDAESQNYTMEESSEVIDAAFSTIHYNGIFYQESQGGELPGWDVFYESQGKTTKKITEYNQNKLVTPYGFFKSSNEGNTIVKQAFNEQKEENIYTGPQETSIQFITYDKTGVFFCEFGENGSVLYRISKEDDSINELLKLQELGISPANVNNKPESIYLNVQNGYVYIWYNTQEVIRQKLQ